MRSLLLNLGLWMVRKCEKPTKKSRPFSALLLNLKNISIDPGWIPEREALELGCSCRSKGLETCAIHYLCVNELVLVRLGKNAQTLGPHTTDPRNMVLVRQRDFSLKAFYIDPESNDHYDLRGTVWEHGIYPIKESLDEDTK